MCCCRRWNCWQDLPVRLYRIKLFISKFRWKLFIFRWRLITYSTNRFPIIHSPYLTQVENSNQFKFWIFIWIINIFFIKAGQEGFDQLRPIAYPQTDVFLVCFSTVFPSSLVNIQKQWISEIRKYCPTTPFLLVGTKIDLRNSPEEIERLAKKKERPISYEEGLKVAKQLKAVKYVECSSLNQQGIRDVFDEAILTVLNKPKANSSKCIVL